MTVKELKEKLTQYPDDMRVVVSGYESGWDDVQLDSFSTREVFLNYGRDADEGQHEDIDYFTKERGKNLKKAKVLAIASISF